MNVFLTSYVRDTSVDANPASFTGGMPDVGRNVADSGVRKYRIRLEWLVLPTSAVSTLPYVIVKISFLESVMRGITSNDPVVGRASFVVPVSQVGTTVTTLYTTDHQQLETYVKLVKTYKVELLDPTGTTISISDPAPITTSKQVGVMLAFTPIE